MIPTGTIGVRPTTIAPGDTATLIGGEENKENYLAIIDDDRRQLS